MIGLCGCGAAPEATPDGETATASEEIVNGTTLNDAEVRFVGLVAIYHKEEDGTFFPRPCSGIFFQAGTVFSTIVTARHCVTKNGGVDGAMWSALEARTSIYIKVDDNPGLHGTNSAPLSTPQADWIPAESIYYGDVIPGQDPSTRDLALITVRADFSKHFPTLSHKGWYMADPATLVNRQVTGYGFGVNVKTPTGMTFPMGLEDFCYSSFPDPVHAGAGIARRSNPFAVTFGQAIGPHGGSYVHANNSGETAILCGDSGGPDLANIPGNVIGSLSQVTGIHSGARYTEAIMSRVGPWVSSVLGMFITPFSASRSVLGAIGDVPALAPTPTALMKSFFFFPGQQRIGTMINEEDALCLDFNGSTLRLNPCVTPPPQGQMWTVDGKNRIQHVPTGRCLRTGSALQGTGGMVTAETCFTPLASESDRARETWFWRSEFDKTYAFCANEGSTCSFSGKKNVRYGANSRYVFKTFTNGTVCNDTAFGGSPISGPKRCSVGPHGFSFCADNGGTCSFSGPKIVAYGNNDSFVYSIRTNGTACNKATLDPFGPTTPTFPSFVKACYVQD